jgi:hypothetical protein
MTVKRVEAARTYGLGVLWSAAVHGYYCTRYIELSYTVTMIVSLPVLCIDTVVITNNKGVVT